MINVMDIRFLLRTEQQLCQCSPVDLHTTETEGSDNIFEHQPKCISSQLPEITI